MKIINLNDFKYRQHEYRRIFMVEHKNYCNEVEQFLIKNNMFSIPIDPIKLAKNLHIEVVGSPVLPTDISGVISKKDDSVVIVVNDEDTYNEKRFTVAHELGHYFLHLQNCNTCEYVEYQKSLQSNETEENADEFGSEILMPKKYVEIIFNEISKVPLSIHKKIAILAEIFVVSEEIMKERLNKLGLISGI